MNDEFTTQDGVNTGSETTIFAGTANLYQSTTHSEDEHPADTNQIRNQCSGTFKFE